MRDALKRTHITPEEKIGRIQKMCQNLLSQKAIKQWDLKIESAPVEIKSKILSAPQIFRDKQVIHCDESVLRKLPIQKPVELLRDKWIMVYQHSRERSNFEVADKIYNTFVMACK